MPRPVAPALKDRPRPGGSKMPRAVSNVRTPGPKPASRRRFVRDLMTETVYVLSPSDDLATLYDLMDFRRVRHVPIVQDGELVGLVTSTELSRCALGKLEGLTLSAERDMLRRSRVRDIMSVEPDTIDPDSPLDEAAGILLENKVGCVPVVEGLRLVGILTEADFVRDFVQSEDAR